MKKTSSCGIGVSQRTGTKVKTSKIQVSKTKGPAARVTPTNGGKGKK